MCGWVGPGQVRIKGSKRVHFCDDFGALFCDAPESESIDHDTEWADDPVTCLVCMKAHEDAYGWSPLSEGEKLIDDGEPVDLQMLQYFKKREELRKLKFTVEFNGEMASFLKGFLEEAGACELLTDDIMKDDIIEILAAGLESK